jgi:hypothetical protein
MSQIVETHSSRLELDNALRHAVTLAWEDLMKPTEPRSIRVEYLCEPGTPLDHLSVWSARTGGYQDLVCDFWISASLTHPSGACFGNRHSSDKLAATLDFIMKNQGQFTRPADAGRHGLVLIYPPDGDDRIEAVAWMKGVQALGIEANPEEAHERPRAQAQRQEEKAWTSTDEESHLHERNATVSDEPVATPAKTNAASYFELRYAWPE